jgi:hypothetical protein
MTDYAQKPNPTPESEPFARYHDERAAHGGVGWEFHARAATFIREAEQRINVCHAAHVDSENWLASARRFANHYRQALEVIGEEARGLLRQPAALGPFASYVLSLAEFAERHAASEPERNAGESAFPLPPEIVEILRDVAAGHSTPDVRGRAGAALVSRDLVTSCQRCGGAGYERIGDGSVNAWGVCGWDAAPASPPRDPAAPGDGR